MTASQSVSLRIPQGLLDRLDAIAVERFPTRNNGEPNRSRVIVDFIEKGIDTVSDNIAPQRQTNSDNIEELIRQQVQFQLQIQQMVRQQLEYSPSFPAITELQLEVAEIKRILKALVTVYSPNTVSDNSGTTSNERDRQSQPTTASTQPRSATQRQSDRSGPEQSQPATASMQPEQRQPEPLIDDRHQLSDNCKVISGNDKLPEQSNPAAAYSQVRPQFATPTSEQQPERDRTELSDSLPDIALQQLEPPSRPSQSQPPEPASEQQTDRIPPEQTHSTTAETQAQSALQPESAAPEQSDRDRPSPTDESDHTPPEQPHSTTAETHAQHELQPQSTARQQSDYDCTELSDSPPNIALQQSDSPSRDRHLTATKDRSEPATALQPVSQQSDKPAPEFPEWMTARQAFESLGGDPGDRNSSINSVDGLKQIKFSTFKKKTSSELKPFRLELSQDRKRRRLPCYQLLKPSDEDILRLIGDLDQRLRTDNYLPIFHLREKLQPLLSREELDQALYRLSRNDRIELSALQEVTAYTPEQINAGIPQNVGGRLFFIIRS